ncbi:hypothetical protein K7G82_22440 [Sphingomonas colocasiae]|uniref:Uncharacterized protein n=2 Tax=Sphingomonas colocasiae TaxID=1848973 RepID=A0ABS7PV52_9SPHN|nr:hypothetical protein [Sphingomonas colocasiae]
MKWPWSKKISQPLEPPPGVASGRYAGKPLLRFLEAYVLWSIDELPIESEPALTAMAPTLTQLFGGDGSWQSAIAATMELPANMPDLIRERWAHNTGIAARNDVHLSPQQFAEMFVDANLT